MLPRFLSLCARLYAARFANSSSVRLLIHAARSRSNDLSRFRCRLLRTLSRLSSRCFSAYNAPMNFASVGFALYAAGGLDLDIDVLSFFGEAIADGVSPDSHMLKALHLEAAHDGHTLRRVVEFEW